MDEIVISEHTVDIFDIIFTSFLNAYIYMLIYALF